MDPNSNLREQRGVVRRLLAAFDDPERRPQRSDALRLAQLAETLDAWLTHGGALPQEWRRGNRNSDPDIPVRQATRAGGYQNGSS